MDKKGRGQSLPSAFIMITIGVALSNGNLGNRIKIRLANGSIIYAIAQTNIVSGQVSVIQDERTLQWHCFSASTPVPQLSRTQKIYKSRPIEEKVVAVDVYILYTIIRFHARRTMPGGGIWDWYHLDYYLKLPTGKSKLLVTVPFSFDSDLAPLFSYSGGFINYGVLSFDAGGNWMVTIVNYWCELIRSEVIPPDYDFFEDRQFYNDVEHKCNIYFIDKSNVEKVTYSTIERYHSVIEHIYYDALTFPGDIGGEGDIFIKRLINSNLDNSNFCVLIPIKQDWFINAPTNHYKKNYRDLIDIVEGTYYEYIARHALTKYDYIYSNVYQNARLNDEKKLTLSSPESFQVDYHAEEEKVTYENGNTGIGRVPATISDAVGSRSWTKTYLLPNTDLQLTSSYIKSSPGYLSGSEEWNIVNESQISPILINVSKDQCIFIDEVKDKVFLNVELSNGTIVSKYIELYQYYKLLHFDGSNRKPITQIPIELFEYIKAYEGIGLISYINDYIEDSFYRGGSVSYHWDKDKIIFPFYKQGSNYKFDWKNQFAYNPNFKDKKIKIDFLEMEVEINEEDSTVKLLRKKAFTGKCFSLVKSNNTLVDHPNINLDEGDNDNGFQIMSIIIDPKKAGF